MIESEHVLFIRFISGPLGSIEIYHITRERYSTEGFYDNTREWNWKTIALLSLNRSTWKTAAREIVLNSEMSRTWVFLPGIAVFVVLSFAQQCWMLQSRLSMPTPLYFLLESYKLIPFILTKDDTFSIPCLF